MRTLQSLGVVSSIAIASAATAQDAVQWRVEDGGNGHWYEGIVREEGWTWTEAVFNASSIGGRLVSCESVAELNYVRNQFSFVAAPSLWQVQSINVNAMLGPWVGGYQVPSAIEPSGGWYWLSGAGCEPQDGINCCNNSCVGLAEDRLHLYAQAGTGWSIALNDLSDDPTPCSNPLKAALVEYAADCNGDGIVDFGQILDGLLADANLNNIPDCCEQGSTCDPCRADIDQSGAVNGVDLAAILNNWGTTGGKQPRSDTNYDGIVNGEDLAAVLNGWGPCP